jgi:hypothetical protein
MKSILIISLFVLFSVASADTVPFLCSQFHILCPTPQVNMTNIIVETTIPVNASANSTQANTTITSLGTARMLSSDEGTYVYSIVIEKSNFTGIYEFAALGKLGSILIYSPSVLTNCTVKSEVRCRASFLINQGTYDRIEVEYNGKWMYAIAMPSKITGKSQQPVQNIIEKPFDFIPYILGAVAVVIVLVGGNLFYYRQHSKELGVNQ